MCHKLSFIVIGQNQQRTIKDCISSIFKTAEALQLKNYEVIYIDSRSSDQTIQIIRNNFRKSVKMYALNKKMNAAIARNVGAQVANGDTYFFIDGDMELYPDFLKSVFSEEQGLKYDVVSGKLMEYEYDENWNRIGIVNDRYNVVETEYRQDLGGVFVVRSEVFEAVGGFNEYWKSEEDFDLAIRLAQRGIYLVRLSEYIAVHHTIDYYKLTRLLGRIRNGQIFYHGIICRKNLFNKYGIKMILENQKFTFFLCLSILSGMYVNRAYFLVYPVLIFFFKYRKSRNNSYCESFLGTLCENISFILGFLFLYPGMDNKKSFDYSEI
jgi:glycosyltransferase involved in cell wall biosynthesis